MMGFSLGDIVFIAAVCLLIWGILNRVNKNKQPHSKEGIMPLDDETIREILKSSHVVAMVGASSNAERPSNHVFEYLLNAGYTMVPVNPKDEQIFGQKVFRTLQDIPLQIDIVDVFRNPDQAPQVAREAVAVGAKVLWLQEGVVSEEARDIALSAGLKVVMDRCMLKEHRRLGI